MGLKWYGREQEREHIAELRKAISSLRRRIEYVDMWRIQTPTNQEIDALRKRIYDLEQAHKRKPAQEAKPPGPWHH